jgi:four helix bundle protein
MQQKYVQQKQLRQRQAQQKDAQERQPAGLSELELQESARRLAVEVYTLTLQFPKYESMVMTPLMRKLSLSVVSNVAKGFSTRESRDFMFFITYANASCCGIRALSTMATDIGYITAEQDASVKDKCICLSGNIAGLMREIERMPGNRAYRKMRKRLGKNG